MPRCPNEWTFRSPFFPLLEVVPHVQTRLRVQTPRPGLCVNRNAEEPLPNIGLLRMGQHPVGTALFFVFWLFRRASLTVTQARLESSTHRALFRDHCRTHAPLHRQVFPSRAPAPARRSSHCNFPATEFMPVRRICRSCVPNRPNNSLTRGRQNAPVRTWSFSSPPLTCPQFPVH